MFIEKDWYASLLLVFYILIILFINKLQFSYLYIGTYEFLGVMLLGSATAENVIGKVEQWYDGFCIQVLFGINVYYNILQSMDTRVTGLLLPFICRLLQEASLLIKNQRIARQIRQKGKSQWKV